MRQDSMSSLAKVKIDSRLSPRPRHRVSKLARRDALWGYAFVSPAVLGFLIFVALPLILVFYFSLQNYNSLSGRSRFVGFENYQNLLTSGVFATVIQKTAIFSLGVIPGYVLLGLALAVLVNQKLPGIAIFRTAYFVPVVISLVAWSIIWEYMLQGRGGVNGWLAQVGIAGPNWLADPQWAMPTIIVVQILKGVGVSMILFLAAFQDVPAEITEAAEVDGANRWQTFTQVVLPLIAPAIVLVSILATINSLKAFAQVFFLTQGGPGLSTAILGWYIYDQAFRAFQIGNASTAAVFLFVIVITLTILQWWSRKRWVFHES
jgi:multiple sugar transport system permease protein